MVSFIVRRFFEGLLVLVAVAAVAFVLFQFVGDPVAQMLPMDATPEDRAKLAAALGLNDSGWVQFWRFLTNACRGDFGLSLRQAAPVAPGQIRSALQKPLALGGGKMLHAMPIRGGYAVWTQDQSALLAMEEQLQELKEELQERNALLRTEYAREQKRRKLAEQNRLFDLLQQVTQKQLDRIALASAICAPHPPEAENSCT